MMKDMKDMKIKADTLGEKAFLGGLALALIVGIASSFLGGLLPYAIALLALLGVIVGLLNVNESEVPTFLIATIAMLLAANSLGPIFGVMQGLPGIGTTLYAWVLGFVSAIAAFISPAAFIVAIRAIYKITQN